MAKVITTELQHSGSSSANITMDSSGNVTCPGNLTITGSVTGDNNTIYDDTKLRRDLNILALHTAVDNNKTAHNLNNTFIENFQDDTALATQTDVDRDTSGEYVSSGSVGSQAQIAQNAGTIIGDFGSGGGGVATAFDGTDHQGGESSAQRSSSLVAWLGKDWGSTKTINGFKVFSTTDDGIHGAGQNNSGCTLTLYGNSSDNTATATDLGGLTGLNFRQNSTEYSKISGLTTTTAYRYHWIKFTVPGNANTFRVSEVEFYENPITVNATGTLISTAQTATDARTKVSGCILYEDNVGTATLGTDLKISFSCDNGSNWTALDATAGNYTAGNAFSTGIKTAHLKEVTCTSGTQIKYKAEWANQAASSKETRLHGIGVNY